MPRRQSIYSPGEEMLSPEYGYGRRAKPMVTGAQNSALGSYQRSQTASNLQYRSVSAPFQAATVASPPATSTTSAAPMFEQTSDGRFRQWYAGDPPPTNGRLFTSRHVPQGEKYKRGGTYVIRPQQQHHVLMPMQVPAQQQLALRQTLPVDYHNPLPISNLNVVDFHARNAYWFRLHSSLEELEELLNRLPNGCFFIRPALHVPNAFLLLHMCNLVVQEWLMVVDGNGVGLKRSRARFNSLSDFVKRYSQHGTELPIPLQLVKRRQKTYPVRPQTIKPRRTSGWETLTYFDYDFDGEEYDSEEPEGADISPFVIRHELAQQPAVEKEEKPVVHQPQMMPYPYPVFPPWWNQPQTQPGGAHTVNVFVNGSQPTSAAGAAEPYESEEESDEEVYSESSEEEEAEAEEEPEPVYYERKEVREITTRYEEVDVEEDEINQTMELPELSASNQEGTAGSINSSLLRGIENLHLHEKSPYLEPNRFITPTDSANPIMHPLDISQTPLDLDDLKLLSELDINGFHQDNHVAAEEGEQLFMQRLPSEEQEALRLAAEVTGDFGLQNHATVSTGLADDFDTPDVATIFKDSNSYEKKLNSNSVMIDDNDNVAANTESNEVLAC